MCGRRAMAGYGFISGKLEIKFLILYIASRLIQPVPFEVLQELSMCDGGVDYFDFAECLADLVRTGHLSRDEEGLYAVTEKGRINGAICESGLAYSVRMQADEGLAAQNERLKRRALVKARAEKRPQWGYTVTLSLSDELDSLMQLTLLVTREDMAKALQRHFQADAEQIYSQILAVLFDHESGEKPSEGPET